MKPTTPTQTTPKLHVCEGCKQTGSVGAKWLLYEDGNPHPRLVHKPCGTLLLKSAPKGVKARLVPTRQLQEEWRVERMAKSFWGAAFTSARPLKQAAKPNQPVIMTVATPSPMVVAESPAEAAKAA
ncbi:MAG: hypothetical protein KBC33_01965 [Candidatus Pacebacteria bacterium]|nr:hypothetical protein [Candidatus Paceibacterota bacterium]